MNAGLPMPWTVECMAGYWRVVSRARYDSPLQAVIGGDVVVTGKGPAARQMARDIVANAARLHQTTPPPPASTR